ncbi:uncharacterized protein LOC110049769, partial [Orbicella faveolata]|uniref:uncharacterized protein LOC110049769 n=1 Tax=Orbicella faveolata TaxID=48498 RepID=UPI0009E4090A
ISHSTGLICFVDVRDGFRTVAEHYFENDQVCGMITFSPDCRSLICCHGTLGDLTLGLHYRLNVNITEHPSCTLDVLNGLSSWELESPGVAGFLLGDPVLPWDGEFAFVLHVDALTVLKDHCYRRVLEMLNINELRKTVRKTRTDEVIHLLPSRFRTMMRMMRVALSLTGETVYVLSGCARNAMVTAWDVSSEEPVGQVDFFENSCFEARLKEGVLLSTANGCLELWNFELSNCIRRWPNLVQPMEFTQIVPISEERVALRSEKKVIILNTTTSEIVSIPVDRRYFVTCNSKCQVLTYSSDSLQLLDGQSTLWKTDLRLPRRGLPPIDSVGVFSLSEQFVVILAITEVVDVGVYVLDAFSGRILHILCKRVRRLFGCQFVSEEECVILSEGAIEGSTLRLFNIESGDLLSVIDLQRKPSHLAVCPRKRLLAIDQSDSELGFELIQVHLPRDKDSRNNKRMPANTPQVEKSPGNSRRYAVSVDFLAAFSPFFFNRSWYRLHIFVSSFNWLTRLPVFFVTCVSDFFGFGHSIKNQTTMYEKQP